MLDFFNVVEFTRIYLAIFFSLVALFYTSRIIVMQKAARQPLVFSGKRHSTTWKNHMLFRFFRVTIWGVCVGRAVYPGIDSYLGVCTSSEIDNVIFIGLLLLTSGFVFTLFMHFFMGKSWRSGIDPNQTTSLITNGAYRFSRNPMFLGVAVAQVGFFLALPSVFSSLCLIIGLIALQSQAKQEEVFLADAFPVEYDRYRQQVRRWV